MTFTRKAFDNDGYIVIRGLLSDDQARFYRDEIIKLASIDGTEAGTGTFECPDGVSRHSQFWPLIYHDRLIIAIRELVGPSAKYTQHSDLHANRVGGWHRDSACRKFGVGPDWDQSQEAYRVVRVAIYLQTYEESGSSLGVVPGSHRFEERPNGRHKNYWLKLFAGRHKVQSVASRLGVTEEPTAVDRRMVMWTKPNYSPFLTPPSYPTWIKTEPGDCVIFDQRLYHAPSPIRGPKYAIYLSYGPEGIHSTNHMGYYRNFRKDLGYGELDPQLEEQLREKGLYMKAPPPESVDGYFHVDNV